MAYENALLRLLNIRYPIIQAPMVGVSSPELAAAVSDAGALGSIGLGSSTARQAQSSIAATRGLTSAPFNVNLFCHRPAVADPDRERQWLDYLAPLFAEFQARPPTALSAGYRSFLESEDTLQVLLRECPAVVSFHFGLPPAEWIREMRDAGMVTLACVTTPREASLAEAAGVDALVAQGVEAGGHRGVFEPGEDREIGTFALIRLIAAESSLPVVAAGGIMDGKGIAAALRLGASGVQLGTAFIPCPESSASPAHRKALKSERGYNTRITSAISGRPARGMVNRLFDEVDGPGAPRLPDYPITYGAAKALRAAAEAHGDDEFAVQWAGQGAPLARALPARTLVETLVRELHEARAGIEPY